MCAKINCPNLTVTLFSGGGCWNPPPGHRKPKGLAEIGLTVIGLGFFYMFWLGGGRMPPPIIFFVCGPIATKFCTEINNRSIN